MTQETLLKLWYVHVRSKQIWMLGYFGDVAYAYAIWVTVHSGLRFTWERIVGPVLHNLSILRSMQTSTKPFSSCKPLNHGSVNYS